MAFSVLSRNTMLGEGLLHASGARAQAAADVDEELVVLGQVRQLDARVDPVPLQVHEPDLGVVQQEHAAQELDELGQGAGLGDRKEGLGDGVGEVPQVDLHFERVGGLLEYFDVDGVQHRADVLRAHRLQLDGRGRKALLAEQVVAVAAVAWVRAGLCESEWGYSMNSQKFEKEASKLADSAADGSGPGWFELWKRFEVTRLRRAAGI